MFCSLSSLQFRVIRIIHGQLTGNMVHDLICMKRYNNVIYLQTAFTL